MGRDCLSHGTARGNERISYISSRIFFNFIRAVLPMRLAPYSVENRLKGKEVAFRPKNGPLKLLRKILKHLDRGSNSPVLQWSNLCIEPYLSTNFRVSGKENGYGDPHPIPRRQVRHGEKNPTRVSHCHETNLWFSPRHRLGQYRSRSNQEKLRGISLWPREKAFGGFAMPNRMKTRVNGIRAAEWQ